jgi:hypothetical protein
LRPRFAERANAIRPFGPETFARTGLITLTFAVVVATTASTAVNRFTATTPYCVEADHCGNSSSAAVCVSCVTPVPSGFMVKRSRPPVEGA